MSDYRFSQPSAPPALGPKPEGDYHYVVTSCDQPYSKNDKFILPVKLSIAPDNMPVFANPWTGETRDGEFRDGIAEFLISCARAPKVGQEPDWAKVVGAHGTVHLKVEVAAQGALAGKPVNKVGWFHRPKQSSRQSQPESEPVPKTSAAPPEPDDLPF